ncbi:MAG: hypothetical protein QOH08_1773, partial [Chloroflexota bacterium]|nr:hypothetical protein [Chloroflexota bacterium]
EAGAWRLLAGSGDPGLAARALNAVRSRLRPERDPEPVLAAGPGAWVLPFTTDGRLVGCGVLLADHDRVLPDAEADFLKQFADKAGVFLGKVRHRQRETLEDRLEDAVAALPRQLHHASRQPEMLTDLGAALERAIPSCTWAVVLRGIGQHSFQMAASGPGENVDERPFTAAALRSVQADDINLSAPRPGEIVPPGAVNTLAGPLRDARLRCVGALVVQVPGDCGLDEEHSARAIAVLSDIVSVALDLAGRLRESRILKRQDPETGCLMVEPFRDATDTLTDACAIGNRTAALILIQAARNPAVPNGDIATAEFLKRFADDETDADLSIARLGTWRYGILAPDRSPREAMSLAARLRWQLRTAGPTPISSTAGLAILPRDGATFDALMRAASAALAEAFRAGGDCERTASPNQTPDVPSTRIDGGRSIAMLNALATMVDQIYFAGTPHSEAVSARTREIGLRLGAPEDLLEQVTLAGVLHDIGRALLAPELFVSASPTTAERRLIQTHVVLGARLVSNAGFPEAADCIAAMHERWDGSGAPHGAAGIRIPLGARILATANAFETVLGGHGRGDSGLRAAITAVAEQRGKAFDPEVVDGLLDALRTS